MYICVCAACAQNAVRIAAAAYLSGIDIHRGNKLMGRYHKYDTV